jgi:hypothetical protein
MAQPDQKLVTPLSLVFDAVAVAAFFALLFTLVRSHVPSNDPKMVTLWAALATSCLSGVFWLALQMLRVVFRAQRAARRS